MESVQRWLNLARGCASASQVIYRNVRKPGNRNTTPPLPARTGPRLAAPRAGFVASDGSWGARPRDARLTREAPAGSPAAARRVSPVSERTPPPSPFHSRAHSAASCGDTAAPCHSAPPLPLQCAIPPMTRIFVGRFQDSLCTAGHPLCLVRVCCHSYSLPHPAGRPHAPPPRAPARLDGWCPSRRSAAPSARPAGCARVCTLGVFSALWGLSLPHTRRLSQTVGGKLSLPLATAPPLALASRRGRPPVGGAAAASGSVPPCVWCPRRRGAWPSPPPPRPPLPLRTPPTATRPGPSAVSRRALLPPPPSRHPLLP